MPPEVTDETTEEPNGSPADETTEEVSSATTVETADTEASANTDVPVTAAPAPTAKITDNSASPTTTTTEVEDNAAAPAAAQESGMANYMAYAPRTARTRAHDSALEAAHKEAEKTKSRFLRTKRRFGLIPLKDPAEVAVVKAAINELGNLINSPVPKEDTDYAFGVETICQAYDKLIRSCRTFSAFVKGKRKPSRKELSWAEIAEEIIPQSERERDIFKMAEGEYVTGNRLDGGFWTEILYTVRSRQLTQSDVDKAGAGTSDLTIKKNADGSREYIKPEERSAANDEISTYMKMYAQTGDEAKRLMDSMLQSGRVAAFSLEMKSVFAEIVERIMQDGYEVKDAVEVAIEDNEYSLNKQNLISSATRSVMGDHLKDFVMFAYKKNMEFTVSVNDAKIKANSTISDRSASTSRLAERLGLGGVVAKSETVMLKKANGSLTRANSMEGIVGGNTVEAGLLVAYLQKNQRIEFSGEGAKQLFELQIFDLISGQIDRHMGNYKLIIRFEPSEDSLYKKDIDPAHPPAPPNAGPGVYVVEGVKAIDNDMSFGEMHQESGNKMYGKTPALYSQDYRKAASIPFISKELYDRLTMPIMDAIIGYDQFDLRSSDEIRELKTRFVQVRNQIQALVASGKMKVISDKSKYDEEYRAYMENRDDYYLSYLSQILDFRSNKFFMRMM